MTSFDVNLFKSLLRTRNVGRVIEYVSLTESTQNFALKCLSLHPSKEFIGSLFLAEKQSAGRGRQDRPFYSSKSGNIYATFAWQMPFTNPLPFSPLLLPIAVPLSVCMACDSVLQNVGAKSVIKWPNDILIHGKKISGVLIDASVYNFGSLSMWRCLVGIGVNVNTDPSMMSAELADLATSLSQEAKIPIVNREMLLSSLCYELENSIYSEEKSTLIEQYRLRNILAGKLVRVSDKSRTEGKEKSYASKVIDVDEDGFLIVRMENGEKKTLCAEEVSLCQ